MLSFFAKQVIKKYHPTIIAVFSRGCEFDPSPAIVGVLSKKFLVARRVSPIKTGKEAIGAILNSAPEENFISKFFGALSLLAGKKIDYPEIIVFRVSDPAVLLKIKNLEKIFKVDFLVILPGAIGHEAEAATKIKRFLSPNAALILKSSDKNSFNLFKKEKYKILTYSSPNADIFAGDIFLQSNGGIKGIKRFSISFKVFHKGSMLPVRISRSVNEKEVCGVLIAALLGTETGINLVEIAGSFSDYQPTRGIMNVIEGIKRSVIIDNSANYDFKSALRALDSFSKLKNGRKIAVIGDILGLGEKCEKYHLEIAGKIFETRPDLVFCAGARANFVYEELKRLNFDRSRLFEFESANEVEVVLQPQIREDDLILVSGSKEAGLEKIVSQIMANPPLAE
ncbi:hypothetical protein KJ575_00455 [Patescibacteria group bacterium]|nr:hypothetical protein [Patescibacteria group bacterium]